MPASETASAPDALPTVMLVLLLLLLITATVIVAAIAGC
jgi:hypothetical protein